MGEQGLSRALLLLLLPRLLSTAKEEGKGGVAASLLLLLLLLAPLLHLVLPAPKLLLLPHLLAEFGRGLLSSTGVHPRQVVLDHLQLLHAGASLVAGGGLLRGLQVLQRVVLRASR